MEPAGLLLLLIWTNLLLASVSSITSPQEEFSSESSGVSSSFKRSRQQYLSQNWKDNLFERIIDVENDVAKSQSAVEQFERYFKTLGFQINVNREGLPRPQDPCESNSDNDSSGLTGTGWTSFGTSKCIKLISGLSDFAHAAQQCREEHISGQDIANPVMVSVDSSKEAEDLRRLLNLQMPGTTVWVDRKESSQAGSLRLNCTELRVDGPNSSANKLKRRNVGCGRLNRVVCQKPLPVSYIEIVGKQLKTKERVDELDKKLSETSAEGKKVIEDLKSLRESIGQEFKAEFAQQVKDLREELMAEFAQKLGSLRADLTVEIAKTFEKASMNEAKYISNLTRMEDKVALGEIKLEELRISTGEEKIMLFEEAEDVRGLIKNWTSEISSRVSILEESFNAHQVNEEDKILGIFQRLEDVETKREAMEGNLTLLTSDVDYVGIATEVPKDHFHSVATQSNLTVLEVDYPVSWESGETADGGCNGFRYVNINSNFSVETLVKAGNEFFDAALYSCRAYHEGNIVPGKYHKGGKTCYIGWGDEEHHKRDDIEVLTNPDKVNLQWSSNNGNLSKAVEGGITREGETLYVIKCLLEEGSKTAWAPGFFQPSEGPYTSYAGYKEKCTRGVEYLTCAE